MATTTYDDATMSVSAIGSRTDADGAPVTDISAEELRLPLTPYSEGYLTTGAFQVRAQASPNMTVRVGSGTAKADIYVVAGDTAGQGKYAARLDSTTVTVTIGASDSSQARVDEVYLVVLDDTYDGTTKALPRIGYRKGTLGAGNPGPDSVWRASVLLARVAVAAGATSITTGNITDTRTAAGFSVPGDIAGANIEDVGDTLTAALAGKAALVHGHDPIAANMTTPDPSDQYGFANFYHTSAQSIATNTDVIVAFRSTVGDGDPLVTKVISGAGDKFTLGASGIWAITATVRFPSRSTNGTGERYAALREGPDNVILCAVGGSSVNNCPCTLTPHWTGYLPAGTQVSAWTYQSSGITLTTEATTAWQQMGISLIRRIG